MKKHSFLPVLLCLLALAPALQAQQADPNLERGITPGKAYAAGEPDTVNLFNGNLNLTIPVGQTYHVGADLSYGLNLYYGGNSWERAARNVDVYGPTLCGFPSPPPGTACYGYYTYHYAWSFPSRRSNAGLGWNLGLGSLYHKDNGCPPTGPCNFTAYESPDGALHSIIQPKLHELDSTEQPYPSQSGATVFYSRDGTYLRYRNDNPSLGMQIEFPDGTVELFDSRTGLLTKRFDQYGNWLKVFYNDVNNPYCDANNPHCASTWHLQDSQGRNHYVYFRPVASYYEIYSPVAPGQTEQSALVPHEAVAEVKLQTFGGAQSSYYFHYEGELGGTWSMIPRQYIPEAVLDPGLSCLTPATMLTSVVLPDSQQSAYTMSYDNQFGCVSTGAPNSGNILTLGLPTGGKMQWTYQSYAFNNPGIAADWNLSAQGVASRTVLDAANKPISQTTYKQELNREAGTPPPESQTTVTLSSGDGTETISKTVHYFSTCVNTKGGGGCAYPTGEYGLPFTRVPKSNNPDSTGARFLSTVELTRDSNGNWTIPGRSTYVRYEADQPLTSSKLLDRNRRPASQRTVYENGTVADEDSSIFDGLGHYRQRITGGTFGRADSRTLFTNFNPSVGTFSLVNGAVTGFTRPGVFQPWVLQTYTHQSVTETLPDASSSTTALTQFCFDPLTGFLKRKRIFKAPASGPNPASYPYGADDLLAVFTPNSNGNMSREQYLGGDNGPVVSTTDTCNSTVSAEAYRVDHTFQSGSMATAQFYDEFGAAYPFKSLDQDIDASTGVVATTRDRGDANGNSLSTNYTYDALGRITDVKPQSTIGGTWTHFDYVMNPPRVDTYHYPRGASSGALAHTATQFDVFGRIWRESRSMPDGTTSIRETLYNGAGWKASVSESETTPTHRTIFTYDPFGRPLTVTAPDGSVVTMAYNGVSSMTKTVGVRTGGDATNFYLQNATTTEAYDRQGRLWKVTDPENTVTEYGYDIGDRLAKVCMNKSGSTCGQTRTFNYDNRGFLTYETQPEKGKFGNATTQYLQYDARGHAGRRLEGPANGDFDLSYQFDRAERMKQISYTGSGRPLKIFQYGTDNDTANGNWRNGKLTRAIRYNWFDTVSYGVQVVEDYTYGGKDGRVSARRTTDYECLITSGQPCTVFPSGNLARTFDQSFTYDDLGQTQTIGYPVCQNAGCVGVVPAAPTVTNGFNNGFLTSVNWTGNANPSTISYWPNGLVKQVVHGNFVTDTQAPDPDGMERPAGFSTTGAADAAQCTAPTIAANPQSATITNTGSAHLTVAATADSNTSMHPVTYQWYGNGGTLTGQTTSALDTSAPGTYWVGVSNGCGSVTSSAAVVAICEPPVIDIPPADVTITRGNAATFTVHATGTNLQYQWFIMVSAFSVPVGDNSPTLRVVPEFTRSYWVYVSNDCGYAFSNNVGATVIAPPTAPVLNATATGFYGVNLTWTTPSSTGSGLHHYDIQRLASGSGFVNWYTNVAPGTTSLTDTFVSPIASYVYRIRAVDTNGVISPWSNMDLATTVTFQNDPVTNTTPVAGILISQLQQAIDSVRAAASLPALWSNYSPATGFVYGSTVMDLRGALDDARSALGLPLIAYTYPSAGAENLIRGADINDLRSGIK